MLGDPSATDLLKRLESEGDDFQTMLAAWSIAKVNPGVADAQQHAVELLTAGLGSEKPELREAAAVGLSELGASSDVVAPALLTALQDASDEQRSNIAEALADLGKPVLKKAIPALENPEFRDIAIEVIGRLGPDAAEAVGPLAAQLASATDEQKARINFALASIGDAASASSAEIAAGLQSDDEAVRQSALFALREFGVKGRGGVRPVAQFFLSTDDKFEKLAAAWTLAAMKPTGAIAPLAAALEEGLSNPNSAVRLETLRAIADLGTAAQPLAAKVTEVSVSDEDPDVREAAEELSQTLGD